MASGASLPSPKNLAGAPLRASDRRATPRPGFTAVLAIAFAGLTLACAAFAEEDGGTRSIFSRGAGNRALAMGSAYVAISDDASALLWNSGGLGRIPRMEFQAGQTHYFALDLSESYLALVAPSWRWGTAAATFRHFGTSGVERRDERNVLLDELSYSETELGLGYGHALGEAVSLGGALKARRQNLGGLSASAFGFDLGVMIQPGQWLADPESWLQNVTWGVSLDNVLEPSLRLDRESVADPRAMRTGLAFHQTLGGARELIAAFDLEKSAGGHATLHSGMELRFERLFALRAGMDQGTLTAGTGVRWRDLALDYVYEQNAVDDVHRMGISYAFGSTVSQSREAALRAEETALQTRLAEAFQKRQAEQLAGLFEQVEQHLLASEFDDALDLLANVNALDPGNPKAAEMEVRCLKGKARDLEQRGSWADAAAAFARAHALAPADSEAIAGELRSRTESDNRAARSAELKRQFADAMEAFGADRLSEARTGFQSILSVEPGDEEAAAMLKRTELAIGRRSQNLIQQATRYLRNGMVSEAGRLTDQAQGLDPRADGLATLQASLARARAGADSTRRGGQGRLEVRPARLAERPALTRQEQKDLAALYKRGLEAMNHQRSDDVLRCFELVWSSDPNYLHVADYLKREYLTRGMESFAAGRLNEAVDFWEKALQVDPKDARTIGYLDRAQKQLARTREILGGSR